MCLDAATYGFGDIGGSVNYNTTTDLYAPGFNGSVAFTNSNYMFRGMATYATGLNKHGWALTLSAIGRYAKEGVMPGTFYNSGGLFLSVEKLINANNTLTLTAFGVLNAARHRPSDLSGSLRPHAAQTSTIPTGAGRKARSVRHALPKRSTRQ